MPFARPRVILGLTISHPALSFRKNRDYRDRKSTRLNSSHVAISYAVFCLKKKNKHKKLKLHNTSHKLQQVLHCMSVLFVFTDRRFCLLHYRYLFLFFFNDTATTEIYTLSLHDALPISGEAPTTVIYAVCKTSGHSGVNDQPPCAQFSQKSGLQRSEEHTSELQSRGHLVCRLLLEKKK